MVLPGWPYCVLASTNLALPASQWLSVATNSFDANGNFDFTNSVAPECAAAVLFVGNTVENWSLRKIA